MQNHIVDSQAIESPRWLKGAGRGYSRCSKCSEIISIQSRHSHENTCWVIHNEEPVMRPSLSISEDFSSESYSSDSLSMSESISFEFSEDSKKLEFSYTTEDVASFVCTMHYNGYHYSNGCSDNKPTTDKSTEDSSAAIEWLKYEWNNGECDYFEDKPNGEYVKAYFTAKYDENKNNYEAMKSILVHDVLTALQRYGVDISSVKYITGTRHEDSEVYIMLPDYCMNNNHNMFRYSHGIRTENDLIGFVRKGTPIIPNEMCKLIEDFVEKNKKFKCDEILVRKFLIANIERLVIEGEYFTLKDMEDSGIIAVYRQIYKHDDKNITLGKILGNYCNNTKLKANPNIPSNQRRRYRLKKDAIQSLLE